MGDAVQDKPQIEKRPLSATFIACMLAAFCCWAAGTYGWKHSLDARGVQWKSQSAFYSSLGRAQAAHLCAGSYDTAFLGSSYTGRIPGVESGFNRWANLGVEASSAVEGINLMLAGVTPAPPHVIVEADRLFEHLPPVSRHPEQDFGAGPLHCLPCFTPLYRASTLLWSELRHETFPTSATQPYELNPLPPAGEPAARPATWTAADERVLQAMQRLQREKGVQLCLAALPTRSRQTSRIRLEKMHYAAAALGVPCYDMNALIPRAEKIEFTLDGHMYCKYALRVAATLYGLVHR